MTTIEGLIKQAYFTDKADIKEPGDFVKIAKALNTASSIPYKPETYEAACGIMKIASQAFDSLIKKASDLEKLSEVRDIIDDMLDRGMMSRDEIQVKTSALVKKNSHELEVFKEAVKLAYNKNSGSLFDSFDSQATSTVQKSMFDNVV